MGKRRAAKRPLLESREKVEECFACAAEGLLLREQAFRLPLDSVADIDDSIARAAKGALLEPRELISIAQTLFALDRAREGLLAREHVLPNLTPWARQLPSLESLAARLDYAFEASGEVSDRASPALLEARNRVRGLHRSLKARLETFLRDESFTPNLREEYYSVRHDRYVLPILASHRQEVPGIIHNASQSGQTLFVEPEALVGMGNELAIAESLVLEEERRVLQELSNAVGREADRIHTGLEAAAFLDEVEAVALLSEELQSQVPKLEPPGGDLDVRALRHPLLLLQRKDVVSNDVSLSQGVQALVISGPNAGGKTVTLTAVGLCALMLKAGLPIPVAEGSRFPLFRSIHSAVGDAQSLAEGLSTFSAHVRELRDIHASASQGSLVLIDEIAADTDPQEGAALAGALLEDLIERGAVVMVTTHLEELKALAHVDARLANARVGFDPRKMAPTYRLQMGAAGSSSAIELAERMGLPRALCERARERLTRGGGTLSLALRKLEEERERLAREADAASLEKQSLISERAAFEAERNKELRQRREALKAEFDRMLIEARDVVSALRKTTSPQEAEELEKRLRSGARELEQTLIRENEKSTAPAPAELTPGMRVRHLGMGRDVEVLEVQDDAVLVVAGALKLKVPRTELGAASQAPAARPSRRSTHFEPVSLRCDVRGMRAQDALRELEGFLDRLMRAGEASGLVVHGHGTGALKAAVRESLSASPYVERFRPGESHEGGDGVTLVTLRDA